jgi:Zn-dependent protease
VTGRSIRIARIAGIPVGISPWWLVIVVLLTWSVGIDFFEVQAPQLARASALALALASVLMAFAGILAHEFAHALVARRAGVEIEEIDLWLLGGVARMRNQPRRAVDELRFALAGPAVTAALALAFAALLWALPSDAGRDARLRPLPGPGERGDRGLQPVARAPSRRWPRRSRAPLAAHG